MPFGVWIEVPCAKCSVTAEGLWAYDDRVQRSVLSGRLKKIGWTRKNDDWFCRACSVEAKEPTHGK